MLCVAFGAHELRFSSPAQLDEAIRVLAMTPLPTPLRMAKARAARDPAPLPARGARNRPPARGVVGLSSHWLSRLPVSIKSAKARPRIVEALRSVRAAMVRGDAFVSAPPR